MCVRTIRQLLLLLHIVFHTEQQAQMTEKIRIKDIAKRAGVSVGTVDRVIHERPNVSKEARKKVEKALKEMNYQPNVYASALAYNRSYTFYCILPKHQREAYWEEVEEGALRAMEHRRDFHIAVKFIYYQRFDVASFRETCTDCLAKAPDGIILVPAELEVTREFTDQMHASQIPFILLDSYMPDLKPLAFFGQDSFHSGYFSAKMFMLIAGAEKEVMLMKQTKSGKVDSKQQANREVGFRHYMTDHFPNVTIHELELPIETEDQGYDQMLEAFFTNHPNLHHCITLGSKAFLVGEFLLRTNRRDIQIMGYDMLERNRKCIKEGSISFLIAQHSFQQGYSCVDTLFRAIVLKAKVDVVNYMPIELLSLENVDFYHRTSI